MKVLQVNHIDLPGRRFNGYDLLADLIPYGVEGTQAVLYKQSHNPAVFSLVDSPGDEDLQSALTRVEARYSIENLACPWGRVLAETRAFQEADVVHYHLVHLGVISLLELPALCHLKPSVWTFHDPWPITGHCVHPIKCRGWLTGCNDCTLPDPVLSSPKMCASQMWRIKKSVMANVNVDIVVSSTFMLDMVQSSPITAHVDHVHLIPFGVNVKSFLSDDEGPESRGSLGIPDDHFVILFRCTAWEIKGLHYVIEALEAAPPERPTTLLTVDATGLTERLREHYNILEFGWVDDERVYAQIFSACDVFLMPSLAESFGLMALEAMAAGRPVVSFEGTAVSSVTHAPDCGVSVPQGDAGALRVALDAMAADPHDAKRRGALGRAIAASEHAPATYLSALASLYATVAERGQA